jgi:hypothetical protein
VEAIHSFDEVQAGSSTCFRTGKRNSDRQRYRSSRVHPRCTGEDVAICLNLGPECRTHGPRPRRTALLSSPRRLRNTAGFRTGSVLLFHPPPRFPKHPKSE